MTGSLRARAQRHSCSPCCSVTECRYFLSLFSNPHSYRTSVSQVLKPQRGADRPHPVPGDTRHQPSIIPSLHFLCPRCGDHYLQTALTISSAFCWDTPPQALAIAPSAVSGTGCGPHPCTLPGVFPTVLSSLDPSSQSPEAPPESCWLSVCLALC